MEEISGDCKSICAVKLWRPNVPITADINILVSLVFLCRRASEIYIYIYISHLRDIYIFHNNEPCARSLHVFVCP